MKNIMKNIRSNKGSGIMTVMLAVLFLTAFGSLALYLTYTSFQVAVSDRYSKEVTYNANTCMEEVKAGMQDIVSEAIENTYRDVMPDYISSAANISDKFAKSFFKYVVSAGGDDPDTRIFYGITETAATDVDTGEDYTIYGNGKYNTEALEELVKEKRGYTCDITTVAPDSEDSTKGVVEIIYEKTDTYKRSPVGLLLKGIKLTFIGKGGRQSSITADIKIGIPNIGYLLTQYSIQGIPEFTFICNGTLRQTEVGSTANGTTISGSAYAGAIDLANDSKMTIQSNSTMICKGDITVNGGTVADRDSNPRLLLSMNSTLWAGNIEIGSYSSARLLGKTYVANDLVFNGDESYAYLDGEYYGFGSSTTDPTRSSSIISNRKGAQIYLERLDRLVLSGVSFITNFDRAGSIGDLGDDESSASYGSNSAAVRMGESFSGKLNQKIYIAPYGSVSGYKKQYVSLGSDNDIEINNTGHYIETDATGNHRYFELVPQGEGEDVTYIRHYLPDEDYNPNYEEFPLEPGESKVTILSEDEFRSIHHFAFNTDIIPDLNRPFSDYGITLKPIYRWFNNDVLVYFFLEFDSQLNANRYFIDYFNATINSGTNNISEMLDSYLLSVNTYSLGVRAVSKKTAGAFYSNFDANHALTNPVTLSENEIAALRTDAEFVESVFDTYCKTLTNVEVETEATNPFDYYIDREKITSEFENNERKFFYTRDKNTAVISNGDFTFDGSNPDLCLIVAIGNVVVTDDFNGLILCTGDVIIRDKTDITNNSESVLAAFTADTEPDVRNGLTFTKVAGDAQMKDYFNIDIAEQYMASESGAGDAWNIADLVTFAKWSRD